ncbi:MAG: TerC family protein [Deferribacteraceae bacterium]|jgi:predicted tellurium resistance membrane protein TerC|nr:TerC family protein [Deferribacteraceae bacterium]
MIELITSPDAWITLATLATLEIILGVDNLVMIAILVSALPQNRQDIARRLGIGFALLTRVCLLFTMSWLASLVAPIFHISTHPVSVRDLVMFFGGFFLLYKGLHELWVMRQHKEEGERHAAKGGLFLVVLQIGIFDIVFSLDSVITAVGMSNQLPIMVLAISIAMAVMLFGSGPIVKVINKHISIKVLALCFIVLIGIMLMINGTGYHMPKAYIYAAMGFSAFVEIMVIWVTGKK